MASSPLDLSISIVSYNTREILLACVRSVYETAGGLACEVIVVDNGSRDGSAEAVRARFPAAVVIANQDNRGYARASNQALAVCRGRHVLLLNSDTLVKADALERMVRYLDAHPDAGAVGCAQLDAQGRPMRSCFRFPTLGEHVRHAPVLGRFLAGREEAPAGAGAERDVEWANGACLMVRRSVLEKLGGLDERFFMYFEDVDLCLRIHQSGLRLVYLPGAEIVHLVGQSGLGDRQGLSHAWDLSRILYVEKHFSPVRRALMKTWIAAGLLARLMRSPVSSGEPGQRVLHVRQTLGTLRRALRR